MADADTSPPPIARRGRPGRPPRAGRVDQDVRERILDVAEAHFAKHGFDAVSTRVVAAEAGATASMIHYYFDSKRKLFDAVFSRRAQVVNDARLRALDDYESGAGGNVTVEGAIEAFLRPVLERLQEGDPGWRHYLALVAQVGHNQEWGGAVMTQSFDPVVQRLVDIAGRALPGAQAADLYWSYHFLSGALMLTMSETDRIDRLSDGRCRSMDIDAIGPRLVAYTAAGFRQLCSERAHRNDV